MGAPRREVCTRCEARCSGDGEGAFLVITCSLVKQGSYTLVWVLQRGLGGERQLLDTMGKNPVVLCPLLLFQAIKSICCYSYFLLLVV